MGPLHAGTVSPNDLDDTFGPEVLSEASPPEAKANRPPSERVQFSGRVAVAAGGETVTGRSRRRDGSVLHTEKRP
ncbi:MULTISPECIES: hypothetical protein [Halostella]|uniref:hypothetical protein n=1 Tax=Halostella TaxID=1843185 RepID=UPI0018783E8F|nr:MULTISPECIES: hypothetical protein [Halostella]